MKKIFKNLCANKFVEPILLSHVETFSDEFSKIEIDDISLTESFYIDALDFLCAIGDSGKDYVNFLFIEDDKGNLSLMLHLSNQQNSVELNDQLYYLQNKTDDKLKSVVKADLDLREYITKRNDYNEGLGKKIGIATGVGATQLVSYKVKDVLIFYIKHFEGEYSALEFKMIQFKSLSGTSDLHNYYKKNDKRISFVVKLIGEPKTEYYNFGHKHP